jgi:hypothetical protein
VVRVCAIEALLLALPRRCSGFVVAVRAAQAEHFAGLTSPAPNEQAGAVDAFAAWLVRTYPALEWLRRRDGLRPPFASDNGLGPFAVRVVPWIVCGAHGEPPRTRLAWERERVLIDLPYHDYLNGLSGPANGSPLAPLVWEIGESERAFLDRARAHVRARQRDLDDYLTSNPDHPLHIEDAALIRSGWQSEPRWKSPDPKWQYMPRELDLHAEWWALHHIEGRPYLAIGESARPARDAGHVGDKVRAFSLYLTEH